MLYKKYHRNFVRQFKKGVRVKLEFGEITTFREVTANPLILEGDDIMPTCIQVPVIRVDKLTWSKLILVFPGGRLDHRIKIID